MKKILKALTAFSLSVVTVLGVVSVPATSAWASTTVSAVTFADVPGDAPFAKEISWLAAQEISTGWVQPDGSRLFKPLDAIGRDAMAAFLYRYAGKPAFTAPGTSPFTDVPTSYPFYKEITWLASRGITTGWDVAGGKKEFRPAASIGRDAMAAFLYRDAGKPSFTAPGTSPFTDVPKSYPFYKEITWLASKGITTGYDNGDGTRSYRPVDPIARNAMAAFLYRYADAGASTGAFTGFVSAARGFMTGYVLRNDGTVWGSGAVDYELFPFAGLTDAIAVTAPFTGYALRGDGTVWTLGENHEGSFSSVEATRIDGLTGITAIADGRGILYALRGDGTLWGYGYYGGEPSDDCVGEPTEGCVGEPSDEGPVPLPVMQIDGLTGLTAVSGGHGGAYALRGDGTVWALDAGADGPLEEPAVPLQVSGLSEITAVTAGWNSGYALRGDGTVWAWGAGGDGQLGNGGVSDSDVPVQVDGLTGVTAVAAGDSSGYALRGDGTVWAWGAGEAGQLGDGEARNSALPVQVEGLASITAIAGGGSVGYAWRGHGAMWVWGSEWLLGPSMQVSSSVPVRVD